MYRTYLFLICLSAITVLQACNFNYLASKNSKRYGLTSYVDPAYTKSYFNAVAIYSDSSDFNWRRDIENKTLQTLQRHGATASAGSRLVPPTREWTQAQGDSILRRAGIDAVLLFEVAVDSTVEQVHVPYKTSSKKVEKSKSTSKNNKIDSTQSGPSKTSGKEVREEWQTVESSGGYFRTDVTRHYQIKARLIDIRNGAVAWVGHYTTSNDGYLNDFTRRVAQQLIMDEVVFTRPSD